MFLTTIKQEIPRCKRAELSHFLSGKRISYSWKPTDFKVSTLYSKKHCTYFDHDHSYASEPLCNDENDDEIDVDYSTIFDCHGNWRQKHKRCIIHVMDTYRISHEAYHELRHAGKGHFPLLSHIRKEKDAMSSEILYIKHPSVRKYWFS